MLSTYPSACQIDSRPSHSQRHSQLFTGGHVVSLRFSHARCALQVSVNCELEQIRTAACRRGIGQWTLRSQPGGTWEDVTRGLRSSASPSPASSMLPPALGLLLRVPPPPMPRSVAAGPMPPHLRTAAMFGDQHTSLWTLSVQIRRKRTWHVSVHQSPVLAGASNLMSWG